MTSPRKTQHNTHKQLPPAQGRQSADSRRLNGQHMTRMRRRGTEFDSAPQNSVVARGYVVSFRDMSDFRLRHCERLRVTDTTQHCAAVLPVQSTVSLRGVGGVSWVANQQHGGGCRQISRLQNSAAKKSRLTGGEDYSASSQSTPIRDRRPSNSASSRATATASAPFTTGLQAAPMRRCPSSSRYSATFSPNDRSVA